MRASSIVSQACETGTFSPTLFSSLTNRSRSSVFMMAATLVPSTSTPYASNTPLWYSSVPQFSAVCPPKDSSMPSGRSFLIISVTKKVLTGKK